MCLVLAPSYQVGPWAWALQQVVVCTCTTAAYICSRLNKDRERLADEWGIGLNIINKQTVLLEGTKNLPLVLWDHHKKMQCQFILRIASLFWTCGAYHGLNTNVQFGSIWFSFGVKFVMQKQTLTWSDYCKAVVSLACLGWNKLFMRPRYCS